MNTNNVNGFHENLSILSHEVKTPLMLISNMAKLADKRLREHSISEEELLKYLDGIIDNCNKIDLMTDNLMDLSEVYASEYELIDMQVFVEKFSEALKILEHLYNFEFTFDVKTDSEKKNIPINATERILLNLITNAVKYNSKKAKKVSLTVSNDEKTIYFTVKDNGDGIPEEALSRVTERFFRVSKVGPSGLGVGLSVVEKTVKNAGGELTFKSKVNKGTEASFTLPSEGNPSCLSFKSDNYVYMPSKSKFLTAFSTLEKAVD